MGGELDRQRGFSALSPGSESASLMTIASLTLYPRARSRPSGDTGSELIARLAFSGTPSLSAMTGSGDLECSVANADADFPLTMACPQSCPAAT